MTELCPGAIQLHYVNPIAINTWAIAARIPKIRQVGLCHSVPLTAEDIGRDLAIAADRIRYKVAGINHMAFFLTLEELMEDGLHRELSPDLHAGYAAGRIPLPSQWHPRCPNRVRYEMMKRLGYFVPESSEHFAEYVPWFIKRDRPDLIEGFGISLVNTRFDVLNRSRRGRPRPTARPNGSKLQTAINTRPISSRLSGPEHLRSYEEIAQFRPCGRVSCPDHWSACGMCGRGPFLVDANCIQPTRIGALPSQLTALMPTNVNVQELIVRALLEQNRQYVYHAAMLDPHTAVELDLDQICALVDRLIEAHDPWLPGWIHARS